MKKQDFFDAMDKLFREKDYPLSPEDELDVIEKEYLPAYRKARFGGLRYCPMCFTFSKKEDFKSVRKEAVRILDDKDEMITVRDVTVESYCPRCHYRITEKMLEPDGAKPEEEVVFCKKCKESKKLCDCEKKTSYIDDSGLTYYASIVYHCPTCGSCVKDISA